jgi:hypothetical protein
LEEYIAPIFRVEYTEHNPIIKACGKLSRMTFNRLQSIIS